MSEKKAPKLRFKGYTDDWVQCKLGDVGKAQSGVGFPNSEQGGKSGIPFYKVSDMNIKGNEQEMTIANNYVTNEQINRKKWTPIKNVPAIFFAKVGAAVLLNRKRLCRKPFLMDNNTMAYSMNQNHLNAVFSRTLFETINLASLVQVGALPSYNAQDIENIKIGIPNLNEQKKIADYFKNIDSLIALQQRKLAKLNKVKKALLQQMFPEQSSKIPKTRFSKFTDHWEQRKLGEVVNFLDTLRKPLEGAKRVKGPYPYYGASGIVDYVDGYLFDEELILLSEDGANITERNYPVCFLVSGKYWVNNHAHVLKIKEDNDNNFICNSLERKDYTKYNTGMAMPKLNKETCKGIPIMCPNYDEQKKIGNYFRKFDSLIALHQRKLDQLKQIKKFLLQNMFI